MSQGSAAGGDPCPADAKLLCWLLSPAHTAPSSPSAASPASGSRSSPQHSSSGTGECLTPCPAGATDRTVPKGPLSCHPLRQHHGAGAAWPVGVGGDVPTQRAQGSVGAWAQLWGQCQGSQGQQGHGCWQRMLPVPWQGLAGPWHWAWLAASSFHPHPPAAATVPGRCQGGRVKGQRCHTGWAGLPMDGALCPLSLQQQAGGLVTQQEPVGREKGQKSSSVILYNKDMGTALG